MIADTQVLYPNVTQTSRRQKCKEFQQILQDGVTKSQTFKVTNVDVNSLGEINTLYCTLPKMTVGLLNDKSNV